MNGYYDLGKYTRSFTAANSQAQQWLNRGLLWIYGYHHEEAIVCFNNALQNDSSSAMALWGIAYASGQNYNKQWADLELQEKHDCLNAAKRLAEIPDQQLSKLQTVERDLIEALGKRYPGNPEIEDISKWNDSYADAMREVYTKHPHDNDVCTLFAEALMNRTPWQLWDLPTGKPAPGASTEETVKVLETALQRFESTEHCDHPGLLHMYIHLMEMSPHPQKALNAGNALVDLVPDAGHLQHMPTHIDVLCGDYQNVVTRNTKAIGVNKKYLDQAGALNFYTLYRCHDYHFKIYGAMFLGQKAIALATADELAASLTPDVVEPLADWVEGFYPMKQHVLVRFGEWHEIINQPLPDDQDLYCFSTTLMKYARSVAYAAVGDLHSAEAARADYQNAKSKLPKTRTIFNNSCLDILAIADEMVDGELCYRQGKFDEAFSHLRKSVELDDNLPYDEPWGWMQPTRHALGALLLEQNRVEEAEAVYKADLGLDGKLARACQHPGNVWSLHGLHECLTRQGDHDQALFIKPALDIALARADVPIEYSCFCRGMKI